MFEPCEDPVGIHSLETGLEANHADFLGGRCSIASEHMAAVMAKHRWWRSSQGSGREAGALLQITVHLQRVVADGGDSCKGAVRSSLLRRRPG